MTPLNHLRQLIEQDNEIKHPLVPPHARVVNTFNTVSNKESKQLKRIAKFLNLIGGCSAEIRVTRGERKVTGVEKIDFYTGKVSGQTVTWSKGTGIKGESDITSIIRGKAVYIELKRIYKNGKDRQSKAQKDFQAEKEAAGALYWIVSSYEDFYLQFFNYINK